MHISPGDCLPLGYVLLGFTSQKKSHSNTSHISVGDIGGLDERRDKWQKRQKE